MPEEYTVTIGYLDNGKIPPGEDEQFANLKMTIEIVSCPIKHGDFPYLCI